MARNFFAATSGQIGIAVTLMLVPLMAGVGLAVDYGNMARKKANLQTALDAATIEMALNVMKGLDENELTGRGVQVLKANLTNPGSEAELASAELIYHGLAQQPDGRMHLTTEARLDYRHIVPRPYGSGDSTLLGVRSRVTAATGEPACVYALNHDASRAFQAGGNTTVVMDGCVIASNSSAKDAVYVGGSAQLEADCIQSSGGIEASSDLTTSCPMNREYAWRSPDPYHGIAEPVPPMLLSNPKQNDSVMGPGRYSNLQLKGDIHLQPGLYYIEGTLRIQGTVTGSGVTFFLKDGNVHSNANASLAVSAPTSGPHAGMLFWSAPSNSSPHTFNGTGATDMDGIMYFPSGDLTFNGNNGSVSRCLRIVADTIQMTGNSRMKSDCSQALGGRETRVAGQLYFSK